MQKKWKPKLKINFWETTSNLRNTKQPFLAINPRLKSFPVLETSQLNIFYFQVFKFLTDQNVKCPKMPAVFTQ